MLVAKAAIYLANFAVDMRKSINGLSILAHEHLESSKFKLIYDQKTQSLTRQQLQWLLSGLDYQKMQGHKAKKYDILY